MSLRPCWVCRQPVPEGRCPRHPRTAYQYRPSRPSIVAGAYDHRWRKLCAYVLVDENWTCRYCHRYATTVDHIQPRSRGGTRARHNLAACCSTCNTAKGDKTLAEWIATGHVPAGARAMSVLAHTPPGH